LLWVTRRKSNTTRSKKKEINIKTNTKKVGEDSGVQTSNRTGRIRDGNLGRLVAEKIVGWFVINTLPVGVSLKKVVQIENSSFLSPLKKRKVRAEINPLDKRAWKKKTRGMDGGRELLGWGGLGVCFAFRDCVRSGFLNPAGEA